MENKMISFQPDIKILPNDQNDLVVLFDSKSNHDMGRQTKVVRIPSNFKSLNLDIQGFDDDHTTDDAGKGIRIIEGKILLNCEMKESKVTELFELAICKFAIPAIDNKPKNGVFNYIPSVVLLHAIKQGVSDAFSKALWDYAQTHSQQVAVTEGVASVYAPTKAPLRNEEPANDAGFKRKLFLTAVAAVLVTIIVFEGGEKLLSPPDPIEQAVANAMLQNPQSTEAQINLTKQTLKSMGLDPGQAGDLGCLTQPQ